MRLARISTAALGILWGTCIADVGPGPCRAGVPPSAADVRARVAEVREELSRRPTPERQALWWRVAAARRLEARGRLDEALSVAAGTKSPAWTTLHAGDLGMVVEKSADGIVLGGLFDSSLDQDLDGPTGVPLFRITLREVGGPGTAEIAADRGWEETRIEEGATLRWRSPTDRRLGGLEVAAMVTSDASAGAFRWRLSVSGTPAGWTLWRVVFPHLALAEPGPAASLFFPKAAGEVQQGTWRRAFKYTGKYPSGWCAMPLMASYDESRRTGLSVSILDPWGSTKDLSLESRPLEKAVVLAVDHPVPGMGTSANRYEQSGTAEWRLLRGDWFDAAIAYREWVRREAKWYPKLGPEGREDTPRWMRELSAWALSGGTTRDCVPGVKRFSEYLNAPTAVHWYNWHEIPFDNDYPHYFPTKPGFADGVRELTSAGTYVMPYINGRLWDSHDRGAEDFEFNRVARPAATKDVKGEPYLETYGSKEEDGSPVRLGVMCPSTPLWQEKVRTTVLRLMTECDVSGVYIDQIAAAAPTLCFDAAHGHPAGGGHWWTEGYWKMLGEIRRAMPAGRMLTTECNGEPYVHLLDGYLTWHWQYDGQVPAFPAVYGGAIQMFGRSYGGGSTADLALRMRAGQQLVFGEQIGWIAPDRVVNQVQGVFFRQLVHLRRKLVRYFHAGEMARPPRLVGEVPTVRADWQWNGVAWVTTPAVLTGAWLQPAARKGVLIFVNVSDEPVATQVAFDPESMRLSTTGLSARKVTPEAADEDVPDLAAVLRKATFPPRSVQAWELSER